MNPVEQAFSDSLNDREPDKSISTNKDRESVHRPLHEDEALCSYILSTVKAPAGALKIRQSTIPDSGSGLFTTRDLAAGELIFTSVPLVLCAEVGDSKEACDFCFQQRRRAIHPVEDRLAHPGETLPDVYKCMGCNLYQYCSESCWQRAWDTGHLYECGLLAGAPYELDIRMLYRILILLRKKVLLPEQVRALARLAHEQDKYEQFSSDWQGVKDIAAEAKQRMKSELDVADVLKLYCLIRCNSVPVDQTFRNSPLGSAIDLGAAMMNHNCEPNIVIVFNSTRVEVRAARNIKAGEELQHCYRDIAYDCTFRSPRIAARYQFKCQCDRCIRESNRHYEGASPDIDDPIIHILATQGDLFAFIEKAKIQALGFGKSFDVSTLLADIANITEEGHAGRRWPDDLEPLPIALKSLAALCEAQGDIINTLKIRVRALGYAKYRNTLPYAEDLVDFVVSLRAFTMYPHRKVVLDGPLPKFKEFEDFCVGHMCALYALMVRFYGEQGRVTRIIRDVMHEEIDKYYGPRPPTRPFRRKFKASHETILKWAGVDAKHWIVEIS
ncbi:hypothetical protein TGAMA5MH_05394 [Trichoderma gamsii]|uniref:Uncharacterized protein n=1 Tax=Trichoderma gamsii TaxID=398673 RepID=A0A2K0TAV0_9HYPO|nr:hypothetical protein TGAMA5MH_05394 [Trichoderma gamsii]